MITHLTNRELFNSGIHYRLRDDNPEFNTIMNMIRHHESFVKPELERLQRYYLGGHDILSRRFADDHKPNHRVVHNFARVITDQLSNYAFGAPINYTEINRNESFLNQLKYINAQNDEQAHNLSMMKEASKFGKAYELCYLEDGEFKFIEIPVNEAFMIYDQTLQANPLIGVRYFDVDNWDNTVTRYVTLYKADVTETYLIDNNGGSQLIETEVNLLGQVPLICYRNNAEATGDWSQQIPLMDAYNILQSDSVNESEAFSDAMLTITGMPDSQQEDFDNMKRNRVMLLDEDGKAEWLTKKTDFQTNQSNLTRIKDDIYTMSQALDMDKIAETSHISSSALRYKLLGTESLAKTKESFFRKAIAKRLEMLTHYLNMRGNAFDYNTIHLELTRNLPVDFIALAEVGSKLKGVMSTQTLLSQFDFIPDGKKELELMRQERLDDALAMSELAELMDIPTSTNPTREELDYEQLD